MQGSAEKQENEEMLRMHAVDQPDGNKTGDNVSKRCDSVATEENV
jgi:hypothetical protein